MKVLLVLLAAFLSASSFGQSHQYVYRTATDSSFNCYLVVYPFTEEVKGLVIRDFSELPDLSKPSRYQFTKRCAEAGFMTLFTNTSNKFPEFFVDEAPMRLLDEMVAEVVLKNKISKSNVFVGGMSASGTRALRYAQYCAQGKGSVNIRGVFVVDAPLDLARFYQSARHHQSNFRGGMLEEAKLILPKLDSTFGGGPDEFKNKYVDGSVFSHFEPSGGNIQWLKNTELIIFHEPDIDWWMTNRGCSYFDINSYDLVACAIELRKQGNEKVEVVTTTGKGFDSQGNRMPHSWSIVDEEYLVEWLLSKVQF